MSVQTPYELAKTNLLDPALLECPHAFYARLRKEAPVCRDEATGFYQVSTYELIAGVNRDPATYSNQFGPLLNGGRGSNERANAVFAEDGYPIVDTMLTADPPVHTRYRKLVDKAFKPSRVEAMEPEIARLCHALIDDFIETGTVELSSQFAQGLPLHVIAGQLGVPFEDLPKFRKWSTAFVIQLSRLADEDGEVEAARDIVEYQQYFAKKLDEKRTEPTDDIISDLASVKLEGEVGARHLRHDEALSIIQQLLVAGNETTTHSLVEGMKLLIEHPDQMAAVRADQGLIPNLVEESLRLITPTQNMWRVATRDSELGGVTIPAGSILLLRYGAANRDDTVFADAERFDVKRPNPRRHMAFGQGIHTCIGAALARKELAVAFRVLLDRVPDWRFSPGRNDFAHYPNLLLRGMKALHLDFTPGSRSHA